jgi:hypothetical protein
VSVGGTVTVNNNLTLNSQSDIRFADSDSSNWVAFQSPATVAANVTWTLPDADATSSGQALTSNASGVLSWASTGGGGLVLQVVEGSTSTQAATTSSSYADTNLSASITPSSTSNKVLVLVSQSISSVASRAGGAVNIVRGSTQVAEFNQISNAENQMGNHYLVYLDSPSTTSSVTYKTQFKRIDQSGTLQAQRNDASGNATSVITLIEISGA